jgi:hypothetical protein
LKNVSIALEGSKTRKNKRLKRENQTYRENRTMGRTNRVKSWEEFKALAFKKKPKSVVYVIAQSIPTSNLTSLKLILPVEGAQYIFTDTAKDDKLRRTGIPIQSDKKGNRYITDEDVKKFLKAQLPIDKLQIFSYWTA